MEGKMKVARSLLRRNDDAQLKVPAFFGARQRTGWNYDESYREDALLTVNFGCGKKIPHSGFIYFLRVSADRPCPCIT